VVVAVAVLSMSRGDGDDDGDGVFCPSSSSDHSYDRFRTMKTASLRMTFPNQPVRVPVAADPRRPR